MKKVLHIIILLASIFFLLNSAEAQDGNTVEIRNSQVTFNYVAQEHKIAGKMGLASGNLVLVEDFITGGTLHFDFASLAVENARSEAEKTYIETILKSESCFDTRAYPTATLEFSDLQPTFSSSGNASIKAKLTIRDITQTIEFRGNLLYHSNRGYAAGCLIIDLTDWEIFIGGSSPESASSVSSEEPVEETANTMLTPEEEEVTVKTYGSSGTEEDGSNGANINSRFTLVFMLSTDPKIEATLFNDSESIDLGGK